MIDIHKEKLTDSAAFLCGRESIIVHPVANQFGAATVPVSGCRRALADDLVTGSRGADFRKYRVDATMPLAPDFFVQADSTPPPGVTLARLSILK